MKAIFAIIVAIFIMLVGWLVLAALLFGIMYVASHAREGVGLLHVINTLLMWVLSPGFGGFLATYITPRLISSVKPSTITTSFISVIITLGLVLGVMSAVFVPHESEESASLILFFAQVAAVVIGAKIGGTFYADNNAYYQV